MKHYLIGLDFDDILAMSGEGFLDAISEGVTGSEVGLTDITYNLIGAIPHEAVILLVSGDVDDSCSIIAPTVWPVEQYPNHLPNKVLPTWTAVALMPPGWKYEQWLRDRALSATGWFSDPNAAGEILFVNRESWFKPQG